jgi:hypothetical protein
MKAVLVGHSMPKDEKLRHRLFGLWREAIEESGDTFERYHNLKDQFGEVAITWGIRQTDIAVRHAHYHVVMEYGFLGKRTSEDFYVGIGGLNGVGRPVSPPKKGRGSRFYELLQPSKTGEPRRVLILGQVCGDTNLIDFGSDNARRNRVTGWLLKQANYWTCRGFEVAVKGHPYDPISASALRNSGFKPIDTLDEAFEWGDVAVAYNSNSLVDAAVAGLLPVPAHPGSLTWPIRSSPTCFRVPTMAERRRWLDHVASHQWNVSEFNQAWEEIKSHV